MMKSTGSPKVVILTSLLCIVVSVRLVDCRKNILVPLSFFLYWINFWKGSLREWDRFVFLCWKLSKNTTRLWWLQRSLSKVVIIYSQTFQVSTSENGMLSLIWIFTAPPGVDYFVQQDKRKDPDHVFLRWNIIQFQNKIVSFSRFG